jgi:hypothetical protein
MALIFHNNNLMNELLDRNSYFLVKKSLALTYTNSVHLSGGFEYSNNIKIFLFLSLLLASTTFNKLKLSQLIFSSKGRKDELIHKSLLLVYNKIHHKKNIFNRQLKNILTLFNLFLYNLKYQNNLMRYRFIQNLVYIVFKQVTIKNTSIGNNTILNKSKVS